MWIELQRPENLANTCVRHTETQDSCFDFIRSHRCVYNDLFHRRANQQPQNAEPKLYLWANNLYRKQVIRNQLVMIIARPINLNVSCKLHPYSLQRTRSPPGPRLPKRIGNTYPRNYYNLKGKDIDIHVRDIRKHRTAVSTLLGLISSVYRDFHHWRSNQRP